MFLDAESIISVVGSMKIKKIVKALAEYLRE
jgi:hypothetical protein